MPWSPSVKAILVCKGNHEGKRIELEAIELLVDDDKRWEPKRKRLKIFEPQFIPYLQRMNLIEDAE